MEDNPETTNTPRIEAGFVGFFDILGYKSFMQSGISESTFKVIEILDGLKGEAKQAKQALKQHLGITDERKKAGAKWDTGRLDGLERKVEQINLRVVSDSILLWCAYKDKSSQKERASLAAMLLLAALVLQRAMFEEGLALRGAIAFGDVIFTPNVFVGLPIIKAYELGQSLDLAACVVHESAENEFKTLHTNGNGSNMLRENGLQLIRYPTPVKDNKVLDLLCLNLAWPTLGGYRPLKDRRKDLGAYVRGQFSMHNKTVGSEVIPKVENTTNFLRACLKSRLHPFQACEHEPNHGQIDDGLAGFGLAFVVAVESAVASEPPEGAFHDPASRQHLEGVEFGAFDDLDGAAPFFHGPLEQSTRIAAVGPDALDAPAVAPPKDQCQQLSGSIPILNMGWQQHDGDNQSKGVHQVVPLAPVDFLAGVVTPLVAGLGALDALAVDDAGADVEFAPGGLTQMLAQVVVNLLPQTVLFPEPEVVIDRAPGREVNR
jgi:hypothetical protein